MNALETYLEELTAIRSSRGAVNAQLSYGEPTLGQYGLAQATYSCRLLDYG
jgi:hypothetical protein